MDKKLTYPLFKAEWEKWLRSQGRPLSEIQSTLASLPDEASFTANPQQYLTEFESAAPGFTSWTGPASQVPEQFKTTAATGSGSTAPATTLAAVGTGPQWDKDNIPEYNDSWDAQTKAKYFERISGFGLDPNSYIPGTEAYKTAHPNDTELSSTDRSRTRTIEREEKGVPTAGKKTVYYSDGTSEVVDDGSYNPDDGKRVDPNINDPMGIKKREYQTDGTWLVTRNDGSTYTEANTDYKVPNSDGTNKSNQLIAEWGYGLGDDFAQYGPNGPSTTPTGGYTWKPSYIMGQEAEKRYAMGDQFAQYLPAAFQAVTNAVPTAPNLPSWDTYNQGVSTPGSFARTGRAPANTNQPSAQGTTQQPLQQGAAFNPYTESSPYSYSNWQRPQTQRLDPNTGQPIQTAQQAAPGLGGTGTASGKTKQNNYGGPSLAAVGTQPQNFSGAMPTNGGYGTQQQQGFQSSPQLSGYEDSKRKQEGGFNPLTSTFQMNPQSGSMTDAANYFGVRTENIANPSINTSGAQKYGGVYDQNVTAANQLNPYANTAMGGLTRTAQQAYDPTLKMNTEIQKTILGQMNAANAAPVQDPNSGATIQQSMAGLMPTITGAIQGALAPKDQYNRQFSDSLYADATRRIDEDTNRQIENIRKQYNAYGLGGSSSEAEALRVARDAAAEKKLSAQRNVDNQLMQNQMQYGNTQLTQLANILGTVGTQQNATSRLGLDLLGTQQNQYGLNQQDLSRQSDVYGQLANLGLQNANQGTDLAKWTAEQNFAGTQAAANTGLQKYSQAYQMQQGADASNQAWNAANQKAQQATLSGNLELANYWDQVAQQELANAQQSYANKTNEALTGYDAQQQNMQNLLTLLGTGSGLYNTFGVGGYDAMRGNLEDIANLGGNWQQRAQQKAQENAWWQPLLAATGSAGA
jgi:hypothetical protein